MMMTVAAWFFIVSRVWTRSQNPSRQRPCTHCYPGSRCTRLDVGGGV